MRDSATLRIISFFIALFTLIASTLTIFTFIGANYGGAFQIFAFYALFQPIFIILDFIFLVYWAIRLNLLAFMPLVALLLNLGFISSVYQVPLKHNKSKDVNPRIVTATYNVKGFCHGQRSLTVSMISDFMKEKNVDILCLQEMDFDTTYTVDSIARAFHYLPYRAIALSEREGFNLMILSKFPIIHSTRIRYGDEGNQAMWADLLIQNDTIRLFNFHLQTTNFNQARFPLVPENWLWDLSGEVEKSMTVYDVLMENFRKRTIQAQFLRKQIKNTKYPVLVCGDMNSNPSSYTYHLIKGDLNDGFRSCGSGYEYTLKELHKLYRIDYIFHSSNFKGIEYKSYMLDYSDHKPVIMSVRLK